MGARLKREPARARGASLRSEHRSILFSYVFWTFPLLFSFLCFHFFIFSFLHFSFHFTFHFPFFLFFTSFLYKSIKASLLKLLYGSIPLPSPTHHIFFKRIRFSLYFCYLSLAFSPLL